MPRRARDGAEALEELRAEASPLVRVRIANAASARPACRRGKYWPTATMRWSSSASSVTAVADRRPDDVLDDAVHVRLAEETEVAAFGRELLIERAQRAAVVAAGRPQMRAVAPSRRTTSTARCGSSTDP
jgi:hypothetical protein